MISWMPSEFRASRYSRRRRWSSRCSSLRIRCSRRIRLKVRWRSQRSCCGVRTSGRTRRLKSTTRRPTKPRWLATGNAWSPRQSHCQSWRSRVGSTRKSSRDGARRCGGFSFASMRRAPWGKLLFADDRDGDLGQHLGVQVDAHRVVAEGLDAAFEIDLAAIDDEALGLQRLGNVAGGHRAVEGVLLADPFGDLDPEPREARLDLLGGAALLGMHRLDLDAPLLEELLVGRRVLHRETLREQVVAAETRLDLDCLAALAEVPLVTEQNDFQGRLLVRGEGDQRQMARPLDRLLQEALVPGAGPGDPPRQDLRALGDELLQQLHVLVVDVVDLVRAELADLAAAEEDLSRTRHG